MGAFMVLAMALFYNFTSALTKGVTIVGLQLTEFKTDSLLLALVIIAGAMLITEPIKSPTWSTISVSYGPYYQAYCRQVPYRFISGVI